MREECVARRCACRARRCACETRRPLTSTQRCVGRARGIGANGGGASGAVCESGGGAGGTSGTVCCAGGTSGAGCCAGGSVWSGVVCCADEGEAKNPNARTAQTSVARCMIGSMFTGQNSRRRRVKHRAEPDFSRAEAQPVSCACASVCGKCRLSFFAQEFGLLIEVASLLIELVGHRSENQSRAL